MKILLINLGILVSVNGFANDIAHFANLERCHNSEYQFEINSVANPQFQQGKLSSGKNVLAFFRCKEKNGSAGLPSGGRLIWNCQQTPEADGGYIVSIQTTGFAPVVSAYVSIQQKFPVQPKHVGTLVCEN